MTNEERDYLVALAGHLEIVAARCDQLVELLESDAVEKLTRLRSSATEP